MVKIIKKKIMKSNLLKLHLEKSSKSLKKFHKFIWTKKMSVDEPVIDKQHQSLLNEFNLLIDSIHPHSSLSENRRLLDFVQKYVQEHFNYEEAYVKKLGYPNLKQHKNIHDNFEKFVLKYSREFDNSLYSKTTPEHLISDKLIHLREECKKFFGDWLINHIMTMDHKYAVYAKKHPLKSNLPKISKITKKIKQELISEQRKPIEHISKLKLKNKNKKGYIQTGILGFDALIEQGIPKGDLLIVAGGTGSGKTIFCLQTLVNKAREGSKCLYMSLEESEEKLVTHMEDFDWNPKDLIKKGKLKLLRINPFDITRNVDALLAKQKGELLIDIEPVILPKDYSSPDFIVIDSLTAIASAFTSKDESYRIYIEQLFRFLEKTKATCFLITETGQIPKIFSPTGVEEFLADGVVVIYNLKHGNVRENAIEILKMRGAVHQKKIVAMQITNNGIVIYPNQEVFSEM